MESLLQNFEEAALPHLGAAYNLARWLSRDDTDAEDVVQEAYLRALRHFGSFHGGDGCSRSSATPVTLGCSRIGYPNCRPVSTKKSSIFE